MKKSNKKLITYIGIFLSIILLVTLISDLFKSDDYSDFSKVYENVKYLEANDGDTARFLINGENVKCRFIAIDTPEVTTSDPFSFEARDYVRQRLENAKKIDLAIDKKSDEYDKFSRLIVWVYVDDKLLQEELVENGLAKVKYIYDDYMFVDKLNALQDIAKKNKVGIWSIKK